MVCRSLVTEDEKLAYAVFYLDYIGIHRGYLCF